MSEPRPKPYETLAEFVANELISEANKSVLPLFNEHVKDYASLSKHLLTQCIKYLENVKQSILDKVGRLAHDMFILKAKITEAQAISTQEHQQVLITEASTNADLLHNLIKEREEYIDYMSNTLNDARKVPKTHTTYDLAHVIKESYENQINVHVGALSMMRQQQKALLTTEQIRDLEEPKLVALLTNRIGTFKKELSESEAELATSKTDITEIDNEITKFSAILAKQSSPS